VIFIVDFNHDLNRLKLMI